MNAPARISMPRCIFQRRNSVDEIPVSELVAPLCVIDIAARAAVDVETQVAPDDIHTWIATNGDIPNGACVAMHSGWPVKLIPMIFATLITRRSTIQSFISKLPRC